VAEAKPVSHDAVLMSIGRYPVCLLAWGEMRMAGMGKIV